MTTSNSRGIGPRPTIVPKSATCRRLKSKSQRPPLKSTLLASSCARTASMRWMMQGAATFRILRQDATSARWRFFGETLHRSGLVVVRGKRCAQPVHVRRAAAAVPRCPRGEFAPRIQFRCGGTNYGRVALGLPSENLTL
jgi:hypothetical protein